MTQPKTAKKSGRKTMKKAPVEAVAFDDEAQRFYEKYGFVALPVTPLPGNASVFIRRIKQMRGLGLWRLS